MQGNYFNHNAENTKIPQPIVQLAEERLWNFQTSHFVIPEHFIRYTLWYHEQAGGLRNNLRHAAAGHQFTNHNLLVDAFFQFGHMGDDTHQSVALG